MTQAERTAPIISECCLKFFTPAMEAVLGVPDIENEDIVMTVERGHGYKIVAFS